MSTLPTKTLDALLGMACGDAFGAPFEYHRGAPALAKKSIKVGRYLDSRTDCNVKINRCRLRGLHTDDTQQALLLLWAWDNANDPLDADEIASLFLGACQTMFTHEISGANAGIHRGTGGNFRHVMTSGEAVDTAGLGAPMRIGPVATLLPDLATLVPWVIRVSESTTTHPVSLYGAVHFAVACWLLAHPESAKDQLLSIRPDDEEGLWEVCTSAIAVMRGEGEEGLLEFARSTGLSNKELGCAANGFALTGVPWALFHGMHSDTFEDALVGVCSSGGDTDTVGAMAGCLAALRFGSDAVPTWMSEGLVGIEAVRDPLSWDPITDEARWTRQERKHINDLARAGRSRNDPRRGKPRRKGRG